MLLKVCFINCKALRMWLNVVISHKIQNIDWFPQSVIFFSTHVIGKLIQFWNGYGFKNQTGLVGPSAGHGSGQVWWIGPESGRTGIRLVELVNQLVPFEPRGSTNFFLFFFPQHQNDVILMSTKAHFPSSNTPPTPPITRGCPSCYLPLSLTPSCYCRPLVGRTSLLYWQNPPPLKLMILI